MDKLSLGDRPEPQSRVRKVLSQKVNIRQQLREFERREEAERDDETGRLRVKDILK